MRERRYVKFRVDMFNDTKMKIIDRKPERDLIYYVWSRIVLLAGCVNLEGDLYISKNIPYTIETLAIEFNRDVEQIKSALEVLMGLDMVELTKANIYRVINFAKHQNIKVKEKTQSKNEEESKSAGEIEAKEEAKNHVYNNEEKELKNIVNQSEAKVISDENKNTENQSEVKVVKDKDKDIIKSENINTNNDAIHKNVDDSQTSRTNINMTDNNIYNSESIHPDINLTNDNLGKDDNNNLKDNNLISLEPKKNKGKNKNKKDSSKDALEEIALDINEEDIEQEEICCFSEGNERPLGEGERMIMSLSF